MNITFIGLGVMGYPMAGHLAKQDGFEVTVYNRTTSKARQWVNEYPGTMSEDIPVPSARLTWLSPAWGADPDLRALYTGGEGIIANAPEGALLLDHTTASASVTRSWPKRLHRETSIGSTRPFPVDNRVPKTASSRSCAAARRRVLSAPSLCSTATAR